MWTNPRHFIAALGGYRKVAKRLCIPATTVHNWITADDGKFPSRLYQALCALADEALVSRPSPCLFRFLEVPEAAEASAGA